MGAICTIGPHRGFGPFRGSAGLTKGDDVLQAVAAHQISRGQEFADVAIRGFNLAGLHRNLYSQRYVHVSLYSTSRITRL